MASSYNFQVRFIAFLMLIILSTFNLGSHARILYPQKNGSKIISSNQILHELGFHDVLKYQQQRPMWVNGIGSDRISPGGPDSQHHYAHEPPTLH